MNKRLVYCVMAVLVAIGCGVDSVPGAEEPATKPSEAKTGETTQPFGPQVLPGSGLAQHDFFYAGEAKVERMCIVRAGKIDWSYTHNAPKGEISDAVRLTNGNILFAHQFGVTEISPDAKVVWNFDAPTGTEIHVAKPIGTEHVLMIENGSPAKLVVMNIVSGATEREFELPVKNPTKVHPQFRDAELTPAGTVMVAHLDLGKVAEYDDQGKSPWEVDVPGAWAVQPLANGNILVASTKKFVREIDRDKNVVWEWTAADSPEYRMNSLQTARRLSSGNTIITNWQSPRGSLEGIDETKLPIQAIEVTPDKKVVWALRDWVGENALGPSTRIQVLDDGNAISEKAHFGQIQ